MLYRIYIMRLCKFKSKYKTKGKEMFFNKKLLKLKEYTEERLHEQDLGIEDIKQSIQEINKKMSYLYESNESYEKCIKQLYEKNKELDKTIEAICECIRKDRVDISGLCQIVKKLQPKGKK